MESLLPIDNTLVTTIQGLKEQQHASSVATQTYIGDWYPLLSTLYTYNSDNNLNVDGAEIKRFAVGKMLRLMQGGTMKYFYIVKVDIINNVIKLAAGKDYTYTSDAIDSIDLAASDTPVGFPAAFNYDVVSSDTVNEFIGLQDANFYMSRGLVVFNLQTEAWMKNGSSTATVIASLPVKGNSNRMHWHSGIRIRNNSTTVGGDLLITGDSFILYKWGGTSFAATGIAAIGVTFSITYLCNE